jgi:hypothetical protein
VDELVAVSAMAAEAAFVDARIRAELIDTIRGFGRADTAP